VNGLPVLRFGLLGPGAIGRVFAESLRDSGVGRLVRVLGRDPARSAAFAEFFGARAVGELGELLDTAGHDAIDALYVATPHPCHGAAVRAALEARVAVLCEKPLTLDPRETAALLELARERQTPLVEGYMYRFHPQLSELLSRVARGEFGPVRRVEAEFAFEAPYDPHSRLFAPELGGGAIFDVGGYPLSFALAVASAQAGEARTVFEEARLLFGEGELAPSGVDAEARAVVRAGAIEAHLRVSIRRAGGTSARVLGRDVTAWLEQPFLPEGQRHGRRGALCLERERALERLEFTTAHDCYALEALELSRLVQLRAQDPAASLEPRWPAVGAAESRALARLAAEWRATLPTREPRRGEAAPPTAPTAAPRR
jgi:predicted dehydrogenase